VQYLLIAMVVVLLGLGVSGARAQGCAVPRTRPPGAVGFVRTSERDALAERLRDLADDRLPPDALRSGAYCYDRGPPRGAIGYFCPVCGERTVYEEPSRVPELWDELPACRRAMGGLAGLRAELDETRFCRRCRPGPGEFRIDLVVHYWGEDTAYRVEGVSADDILLLAELARGEHLHVAAGGWTTPLRWHVARLERLTGAEVDGEEGLVRERLKGRLERLVSTDATAAVRPRDPVHAAVPPPGSPRVVLALQPAASARPLGARARSIVSLDPTPALRCPSSALDEDVDPLARYAPLTYVCPTCGRATELDVRRATMARTFVLPARRILAEAEVPGLVLDEGGLCPHCRHDRQDSRPKLVIPYADAPPDVIEYRDVDEVAILAAFLGGRDTVRLSDGRETPLSDHAGRIASLLRLTRPETLHAKRQPGPDGAPRALLPARRRCARDDLPLQP
jgi:hypothetical protein